MTTPPTTLPTWATDGGAEISDPGTSKQATGFLTGEAPAAGNMNWLLNNQGEWFAFFKAVIAPSALHQNVDFSADTPWDDIAPDEIRIQYLEDLGKWYCATLDTSAGDVWCYESTDGITWSGVAVVTSGASAITQFATDGTKLAIGISTTNPNFYLSSDGTVANLASTASVVASHTFGDAALVWDPNNSVWVAGVWGNVTTTGDVYTSPDGTTWTLRYTNTTTNRKIVSIAVDPAGRVIVGTDATQVAWTADSIGSYTESSTGAGLRFPRIGWSEQLQLWFAVDTANSLHFALDGVTWADSGFDVSLLVNSPDGLICVGASGDSYNVRLYTYGAPGAAAASTDFNVATPGFWSRSATADITTKSAAAGGFFQGKAGHAIWSWDTTYKQASVRYG